MAAFLNLINFGTAIRQVFLSYIIRCANPIKRSIVCIGQGQSNGSIYQWSSYTFSSKGRNNCTSTSCCSSPASSHFQNIFSVDICICWKSYGSSSSSSVSWTRSCICKNLRHISLEATCQGDPLSSLSSSNIVLISRQCHSRQNTNNRHHDHQFNQGKALLHCALHRKLLSLWMKLTSSIEQVACQRIPTYQPRGIANFGCKRAWNVIFCMTCIKRHNTFVIHWISATSHA